MHSFKTNRGTDIEVSIANKTEGCIEICVINKDYDRQLKNELKLLTIVAAFHVLALFVRANVLGVFNLIFIFLDILLVFRIVGLVKSENVCLVNQFALQLATEYSLGRRKIFTIPTNLIHDTIINEVFLDLKVVYLLQILTKGRIFKHNPIIPVLDKLQPNLKCLELIYSLLQQNIR